MAASDTQMLNDLIARIEKLEQQMAEMRPKELHQELYGEEVDHTADRNERAEIARRGPGRPPGQK
jgi:hypothetical protein